MKILLGLTGSVATKVAPKILRALQALGTVEVVMTESSIHFHDPNETCFRNVSVYRDSDEWLWRDSDGEDSDRWSKGDDVLHVDLGKISDVLVIAPATMNTIAKMVNGIADNLLTSIYAAWDTKKLVVIAPAMNTNMWYSAANQNNVKTLIDRGVSVVWPVEKKLACGDVGMGAMADVKDITGKVAFELYAGEVEANLFNSRRMEELNMDDYRWSFPLRECDCNGIPVGEHPGAFGNKRKHGERHGGVDLYCQKNTSVYAVESGIVVSIELFTGELVGSPWWNDTWAVRIAGDSGIVVYGEIDPTATVRIGQVVTVGSRIGKVIPVLKEGKERKDILGHSTSMLHFQWYTQGVLHKSSVWNSYDEVPPEGVLDPTEMLKKSLRYFVPLLDVAET